MSSARQIAEAYFAAALDRGDLEDALRQLRHDVEFDSPAVRREGRQDLLAPRLLGRRHRHGPARTDALRSVPGPQSSVHSPGDAGAVGRIAGSDAGGKRPVACTGVGCSV
jgi:hypothetical protein